MIRAQIVTSLVCPALTTCSLFRRDVLDRTTPLGSVLDIQSGLVMLVLSRSKRELLILLSTGVCGVELGGGDHDAYK